MTVRVVFDNKKDKELLDLMSFQAPFFVDFIDFNTKDGKREAYRLKAHYGAIKNPFVEILDDSGRVIKVMYSENGSAIQSLIRYLNESFNQKTE